LQDCATCDKKLNFKFYQLSYGLDVDRRARITGPERRRPGKDHVQPMGSEKASNGVVDAVWKLLASIQLTIVLLLSLAITSVIGTLIPQNSEPAAYVAAFGETLYRFFAVLGLFDMYHSWWFQVLMVLLAANVVVCSADSVRAQTHVSGGPVSKPAGARSLQRCPRPG
jgi:ResB-like family